jgi:type 1 glutamine amidotransferase
MDRLFHALSRPRLAPVWLLFVSLCLSVSAQPLLSRPAAPGTPVPSNSGQATETQPRKKLLFLTYPGVAYHQSLDPAEAAVTELGKAGGFDVTVDPRRPKSLEGADKIDVSFITPEYLAQFDGLMMMTNGNPPFTEAQKRAMVEFVRNGKALIGAHCATVTFYDYPPYGEMLGAYYRRSIRQGAIAVLKVEDPNHPATKMLGGLTWPVVDEFYHFAKEPWDASRPTENVSSPGNFKIPMGFSRDRVHVLLSIDTERSDISKMPEVTRGGDYPQAWDRTFGKGRVFYTALGHRADIWSNDPVFRAHITGGIRWALGLE